MSAVKEGGRYRHYKGPEYRVHFVATSSETLEKFVVYETLYECPEGKMWIRPLSMFTETVEIEGKRVPRFELID